MTLPAVLRAPRRSDHVLSVAVGDETVLYDRGADVLHHLDLVASQVWSQLDGDRPIQSLVRELADRSGAAEERVGGDVRRLLDRLAAAGLLEGWDVDRAAAPAAPPEPSEPAPSWAASGPLPDLPTPHATRPLRALEHRFRVVTNRADICDWLDTVLVDLAAPDDPVGGRPDRSPVLDYAVLDLGPGRAADRYLLGFNGAAVARSGWLDRVLNLLLWHVNTESAARSCDDLVLLHAAAAARDDRAVLLPAPMEHGKTTTVAGLVRAGWQYLTDEMVALDPASLWVVPYPRPMCVDRGSWAVLADLRPAHAERISGQWQVPASAVRPDAVAAGGAVPWAVVVPRYRAGGRTDLQRLTPGEVLMALADSTLQFRADPRRNLETLAEVSRRVPGYRLSISRLDHAVALVDLVAGWTG